MESPLSENQMERLVREALEHTPEGLTTEEISGLADAVGQLAVSAATWELWQRNRLTFAWKDGGLAVKTK